MSDPRIPAHHDERTLFGRADEQRRLHEHLSQAESGRGSLAFVSGEAGIGKTALVQSLVGQATRNGVHVLAGHCYDLSSTPPYGPWVEILSGYRAGDGLPPLDPDLSEDTRFTSITNRDTFFQRTLSFLSALSAHKTLLLILEDVHWTDPASLDLLRFLGRHLSGQRILVVATYRHDELERGNPLYQLMPALVRESTTQRLSLHGLGQTAIQEYVAAHYRLAEHDESRLVNYLQRLTGGNPFLLEELLHTLEEDRILISTDDGWSLSALDNVHVPSLIRQVVDSRLSRLGGNAVELLEIAAIIGEEVPAGLWSQVSGQTVEHLASVAERLIESRLMEETPTIGTLRFRHALVRQALYERTVSLRRQIWHRRVAEALVDTPKPEPSAVAYHFQQSGDARAFDWLVAAGEHARRLYAPRVAIEHLSAAFNLAAELSLVPPLRAYRARGAAYETTGDFERARGDYQTALHMARNAGERRAEWQALIDLGMLWAERDYSQAGGYFTLALQRARDIGDRATLGHSLNRMGNWHLNVERPLEASGCHEEALAIFRELDDRGGIAATLDLLGMAHYLSGDLVRGTESYRQAVLLFDELGDRQGLASSLATLTMRSSTIQTSTMVPGQASLAQSALDGQQSLAVARDIGWRAGEAYALWMLGFSYGSQGDYERALDAGRLSLRIAEEIEHLQWMTSAHFTLGGLYLDLFALATAREHLQQALEMAHQVGSAHWIRSTTGFLASTCIAQGDLVAARSALDAALDDATPVQTLGQRLAWCARAELELATRRPDAALAILDRLTASTLNMSDRRPAPRLALLRGQALFAARRIDDAESALLAARNLAGEQGARPLVWRIQAALGTLYQSRSNHPRAEKAFFEARGVIEDLATHIPDSELRGGFLDAARDWVPAVPSLTSLQAAKLTYDGVTARQREIARLIALGRTNREIAGQLSVSPRTVETHVTHILTTLDASSRAQIAAWAVEKGLVDGAR